MIQAIETALEFLDRERKRAWLEDVIIRAGLAHVLPWSTVHQMLEVLDE